MTHDEMIAVIQAHRDGEAIECRWHESTTWCPAIGELALGFDFIRFEYRVKPRRLTFWLNVNEDMSVQMYETPRRANECSTKGVNRIACVRIEFTKGQFDDSDD